MAEFSSSTIRMRMSEAIISAVETALIGRMIANGTSRMENSRSSRNDGSCRTAAKNPSRAKRSDERKFRKVRRLGSGEVAGLVTGGHDRDLPYAAEADFAGA